MILGKRRPVIVMSSTSHYPFQDITNRKEQDPKEIKKQRDRKWYAKIKMRFQRSGARHDSSNNIPWTR